ncbi:phospholipase D [Phellopilus nigrolimitatus]|nr:phospholipase D [Phellopilus nigrolimitatus]
MASVADVVQTAMRGDAHINGEERPQEQHPKPTSNGDASMSKRRVQQKALRAAARATTASRSRLLTRARHTTRRPRAQARHAPFLTVSHARRRFRARTRVGSRSLSAKTTASTRASSWRSVLDRRSTSTTNSARRSARRRRKERKAGSAGSQGEDWIKPLKWLGGPGSEQTQESPKDESEGWSKGKGKETIPENGEEEAEGEVSPPSPAPATEADQMAEKEKSAPNGGRPSERTMSHDQAAAARKFRLQRKGVSRAHSMPHMKRSNSRKSSMPKGGPRWGRLRSLLPQIVQQAKDSGDVQQGQTAVQSQAVNITDELITGGLSALMLKLWFERDERGCAAHTFLHPLSGNKAVFRIECEYANGAARWVVYRQLRDFVSLHTHYRLSNTFNRNVDALPEFPRTSLPYFKFLKKEGRENNQDVGRADFAVIQRETLENYLIGLIRAVMFHPTSNRLAGFLEISALSISLAQSGGWQAKAGMLTIEAASKKSGGFGRKSVSWTDRKKQRWCAVRDSYLVAVEEPGEILSTGLNLLHHGRLDSDEAVPGGDGEGRAEEHLETHGTLDKVKTKVGRALQFKGRRADEARHSTTVASLNRAHARSRSDSASSAGSSSSSDVDSEGEAPMVDPSTNMDPMSAPDDEHEHEHEHEHGHPTDPETAASNSKKSQKKRKKKSKDVSKHTFFISNSQMRLKLFAKSERQMQQWITALEKIAASSHWAGSNRFGSFAPIRLNVAAQWLVDGRDYMWNLSRALLLARERIYIHDWWLSPELQMRRPHKDRYTLDKLLERKAKEGVKIYVILYQEVSTRTTPTDSNYTKQRLTALHPNILVQRSPSHFQTGTFYWAHHEKLCVIDEAIAFMGGVDLCFGRWDTPQHVLIDDPDQSSDDQTQIWPGKDYSNARISDFFTLNKPYEDMYDRQKVPRMPWHDVGMHIRWNYLLRIKNHSRTMPFLLPPPDFKAHDLQAQGLTGTCEIQICRSCGPWSMGTPARVEHSIQNAYLKAIQMSDHFVYIENQFFITSTIVNDTPIENKIGDALVHRIIRAHREGTTWKACIMIPLLPGFPSPVDNSDASSVRIILECQNRTICRGPHSIFSRLRKEGIDPDEYISVFSLRNWGKLPGNVLTSEMVYIHGKVCIVDDRLAIIGSANINERSQRGDRDSELASIIRDTDMIDGTMAGKPYKVGRFAHTLRVRLMREHIGVDVDAIYEEDLMAADPVSDGLDQRAWDPDHEQHAGAPNSVTQKGKERSAPREAFNETMDSVKQVLHGSGEGANRDVGYYSQKVGIKPKGIDGSANEKQIKEEREDFSSGGDKVPGFASAVVPTLEEKTILEHRPPPDQANGDKPIMDSVDDDKGENGATQNGGPPQARVHNDSRELFAAPADASKNPQTDDEPPHARKDKVDASAEERAAVHARGEIRKHLSANVGAKPWTLPTPRPEVDPHGFEDPVCDEYWKNVWVACAVHNTEIFRKVFHCVPDDTVTTWKQYKEFVLHHERLNKPLKESGPEPVGRVPSETGDEGALGHEKNASLRAEESVNQGSVKEKNSLRESGGTETQQVDQSQPPSAQNTQEDIRRTPTRADEPFEKWERDEMERLLGELRGHLVLYPTRFLEGEDVANNFLFNADRLLPMPIYD